MSRFRSRGDEARDAGDWQAAAAAYAHHCRDYPRDFAIWVQLGHVLKESGQLEEADRAYARASGLRPRDGDLLLSIGHLAKRRGDQAAAARAYRASIAVDGNADAISELALLVQLPGRPDGSDAVRDGDGRAVGNVDLVRGRRITGWALDPEYPDTPAELEVLRDGVRIALVTADRERPDVEALYGRLVVGFAITVDLAPDRDGEFDIRLARTGQRLANAPAKVSAASARNGPAAGAARIAVVKPLAIGDGGEWALFVSHAPTGALKPHVLRYLQSLRAAGLRILLIVQADRPTMVPPQVVDLVEALVVRENQGYDFAAWAHALHLFPELYGADRLVLANDSLFGPTSDGAMAAIMAKVRSSDADMVALTESLERGWHLQSYFLSLGSRVVASYAFQLFMRGVESLSEKDEIIDRYEVPLARLLCEAGFTTETLFPLAEARNPTLYAAAELLDEGFPFVKMLLLREQFPHIGTARLRVAMTRAGFDMRLLERALNYGTGEPRPLGDWPLLAKPGQERKQQPLRPYKVAYLGPWNYDNGLGFASRAIIGAIRRSGVQLSLHPIKLPFHVHKPLAPAIAVNEFSGDADIAVVHLNPDSWHLLTAEQRAIIGRAGKRIGYWVWEMEHIPGGWRQEFSSVDRIWAPSGYCAEVFAAAEEAKVDVVPHPVPVPAAPSDAAMRALVLAAAGVPGDRRVILYVFDGSSYLVRKNPHALVRSFAASKLADRGWTLLLKTKHLGDRADDGAALRRLVGTVDGVVVLERNQTRESLLELIAACDIYVSPHASEGFGLTVAEAMAAGKPVIATDYGGTRQFLDAAVGYPVPAKSSRLSEDFGHYTKGGRWAAIDETALARTLDEVAHAIETGTETRGPAARDRIAAALSCDTIGAAVAASFDAVLADDGAIWRPLPRANVDPEAGVAAENAEFGAGFTVVLTGENPSLPNDGGEAAEWIVFVPRGARLDPALPGIVRQFAAVRPDAALIYADDVAVRGDTLADQLALKPDFDRWHFAAAGFTGWPLIVRADALAELGGIDAGKGVLALENLILRALVEGLSVVRLDAVLLAWPDDRPEPAPRALRRELLERSSLYRGYAVIEGPGPDRLALARAFGEDLPPVTIVVPTCRTALAEGGGRPGDPATYVERLLASLAATDWPMDRLTVIVADDLPDVPDWSETAWPFALRRIATPRAPGEPFNYAAKMNRLWKAAETRHIVMMNDDVAANDPSWLKALMTFAMDDTVGGVGPRLLYEDGTVQHAGVVMGPMGTCIHPWLGRRAEGQTYQDWGSLHRQWSAVTGAVFATRREVLEEVDGFDERFALEFNDIDLCLRIRLGGRSIVYTPHAEMVHAEKASRMAAAPPGDQLALFLDRWSGWLAADPFYHPGMRRDTLVPEPAQPHDAWYLR